MSGWNSSVLLLILAFGALFSLLYFSVVMPHKPGVVTVIVPEGTVGSSESKNFEPSTIKVVIGLNNTVRWHNQDLTMYTVVASSEDDPLFHNATTEQCENNDYQDCRVIPSKNQLPPGGTFEFTFTKPGVYDYHSVPHPFMQGTVVVLPLEEAGN